MAQQAVRGQTTRVRIACRVSGSRACLDVRARREGLLLDARSLYGTSCASARGARPPAPGLLALNTWRRPTRPTRVRRRRREKTSDWRVRVHEPTVHLRRVALLRQPNCLALRPELAQLQVHSIHRAPRRGAGHRDRPLSCAVPVARFLASCHGVPAARARRARLLDAWGGRLGGRLASAQCERAEASARGGGGWRILFESRCGVLRTYKNGRVQVSSDQAALSTVSTTVDDVV